MPSKSKSLPLFRPGNSDKKIPSLRSISRLGSFTDKLSSSPSSTRTHSPSTSVSSTSSTSSDDDLIDDILQVRRALDLFLDSRIQEAENILQEKPDSMYYSLGLSFILFLKCMMTFQQCDVQTTLSSLKKTIQLAGALRKPGGWFGHITTWMKGSSNLDHIKSMTRVERHAELVYAEAYLLKALLSMIHDESVMGFLRESLSIRSSYTTYCNLEKYVDFVKQEAAEGKDISTYGLDDHFTSGVALGIGCFNIILSLLPSSVIKVAEFIGFSSDRSHGLAVLESIGGWDELGDDEMPESQGPDEGLRRQLCDMVLIMYHIVLSKMMPLSQVNEPFAEKVLSYNLKLYPSGVFFLYLNGRLLTSKRQLEKAKAQYDQAIQTQKDWKQLQHMCYWELGVISFVEKNWQKSYDIYHKLCDESNWSKAVYTYLKAVSLYLIAQSLSEEEEHDKKKELLDRVDELMGQVESSKQKIAGKSIPMEKFVSRKSRKFLSQKYLLMPDLEILNAFTAFDFMPHAILSKNLDVINEEIEKLPGRKNHENFDDDLCLAYYLRALTARSLLEQENAKNDAGHLHRIHQESIQQVLDHANRIRLDHYIYYFSRYENARLLMLDKKYEEAEKEIQVILTANDTGKYNMGAGPHAKNKYSLANALVFKCHNCLMRIQNTSP
ncbi:uncharacterized protein BYT42DRAFT_567656 [Radiomyces spectabilis]|uniref:uncharacterized protein n=1 Tax=Radiomyces spectabilis TaxID=64574 RepID=UPI00221FD22C|nr:uncharacterized protein BYT42DRAFT_567656 [Radiomyces spectabilis]KAI8379130.1 hypothetical protein BYT42DRAFT_567656 [Radiomyces spectabilis]